MHRDGKVGEGPSGVPETSDMAHWARDPTNLRPDSVCLFGRVHDRAAPGRDVYAITVGIAHDRRSYPWFERQPG
jgi:hypothetical protein